METSDAGSVARNLGPYQLGLLLGQGGMGQVYKAFDERLGRWVAIKRVRTSDDEGDASDRERQRFRHEARTLAQLGHPGIVQIFDILEDMDGDAIVMELIDGPTLAELRRDGPLLPSLVLDYGRQIASALSAAHASGVVHRDLKTENVMVMPPGFIKVLDFGLARRAFPSHDDSTLVAGPPVPVPADAVFDPTKTGRIVGTPRAMSPEQALGRELDARSDLFSLGVLLYEIATARSPFSGRTLSEILRRVIGHRPPQIRRLNPAMPRELSELVEGLLEKDPDLRPPSAGAVEAMILSAMEAAPEHRASVVLSQVETLADTASTAEPSSPADGAARDTVVVKTLLLSDLVGSTEKVEALGDRPAAELFRRHDRVARDLMEVHGGQEIDKSDGFLLLFARPWNAVAYALAYHRALDTLDLEARVGIHLGEVVLHRNSDSDVQRGAKPIEVEGLAKPTAARLMSLAIGGQTLLTRAAFEVARRSATGADVVADDGADTRLEWPFHGRYRFQGLAEAVEVFEVGRPGIAPLIEPAGSDKVRRVDSPSMHERLERARADLQPRVLTDDDPARAAVLLRTWPPPELPEQPYPVLLPYTHPAFLAGRDTEISKLWRQLELPVPILGLSAPSGTGKSSLLLGGLVPLLREAGVPVAAVRHPSEPGIAARLIGDLLEGADLPSDAEANDFVERLTEAETLAGTASILVLDQFEDVLRDAAVEARARLGTLMASSLVRRPGLPSAPCRWLIAYRREFHGQLRAWLGDALADARAAGIAGIEALPHDLSQPERFQGLELPPLATAPPGAPNALAESTRVFLEAIEAPLSPDTKELGLDFPYSFAPGHAESLARAFAVARLGQPNAPLVPELQVVLAHLLSQAGRDGLIRVPEDAGSMLDQALDDHLRRALQRAFPADTAASSTRRARALLALRELATSTGRREDGLRSDELAKAIGEDGESVLERLATPLTRLIRVREASDGLRWTLSQDRMALAVIRLVEEEGRRGRLVIDSELLALRRFVTLRTELHRSGESDGSTQISRHRAQRIEEHAEALLWDAERRSWFSACCDRRRKARIRAFGLASLLLGALISIGWVAWVFARHWEDQIRLRQEVAEAPPEVAFGALHELMKPRGALRGWGVDDHDLLVSLRERSVSMNVLEWGLGALEEPERSQTVLRTVRLSLPWVEEDPEDFSLIANLVWALDSSPGRNLEFSREAHALREQVLEPLRKLHPPPPNPDSTDPDWIGIPFGCFLMGGVDSENQLGTDSNQLPPSLPQHEVTVHGFRMQRHEVTIAQYRRLVSDYKRGADGNLPAANITWYAAYAYAAWLGGRLITEAEWEYAARADCSFDYCDRDGREATIDSVAWTSQTSGDPKPRRYAPSPVMGLEPNAWGLFDMLGNVREWTADGYSDYADTMRMDSWGPPPSNGDRVVRGGSFRFGALAMHRTNRGRAVPRAESSDLGFRVVFPDRPSP